MWDSGAYGIQMNKSILGSKETEIEYTWLVKLVAGLDVYIKNDLSAKSVKYEENKTQLVPIISNEILI